jgi:hypothetical protein
MDTLDVADGKVYHHGQPPEMSQSEARDNEIMRRLTWLSSRYSRLSLHLSKATCGMNSKECAFFLIQAMDYYDYIAATH